MHGIAIPIDIEQKKDTLRSPSTRALNESAQSQVICLKSLVAIKYANTENLINKFNYRYVISWHYHNVLTTLEKHHFLLWGFLVERKSTVQSLSPHLSKFIINYNDFNGQHISRVVLFSNLIKMSPLWQKTAIFKY